MSDYKLELLVGLRDYFTAAAKEVDAAARDLREEQQRLERSSRGVGDAMDAAGTDARQLGAGMDKAGTDARALARGTKEAEQAMEAASEAAEKLGQALGDRLANAAKAAAGVAGLGAVVLRAKEVDRELRMLAAGTDLTVDEALALAPALRSIREEIVGLDVREGREVFAGVRQQMQLEGESAEELTKRILMLNRVHANQDPAEILRAVTNARAAWGGDANATVDLMSTALELAGDKWMDLMDTVAEYAPLMADAGISQEQFFASLIGGARAGAMNYDKVGDVLKESFKARITDAGEYAALMDGTKKKAGVIDEMLGAGSAEATRLKAMVSDLRTAIVAGDADAASTGWGNLFVELADLWEADATQARMIMEKIVGNIGAEDMSADALRGMGEGIRNATGLLGSYADASRRAYDESTTFWDRLSQSIGRVVTQIELAAEEVGGWLSPMGDALIRGIDGAAELAEQFRGLALGIASGAAVGGILSGIAAGLGAVGIAAGIAGAPIWAIALAIGAVVAAGYEVYKNWDAISAKATEVWGQAKAVVNDFIAWFQGADLGPAGQAFIASLARGIQAGASTVHAAIVALIESIRGWIAGLNLFESGKALIRSLANGVKAAAGELYESVKSAVAKARELLPFSDAKEGPLSTLSQSGRRLMSTLGEGVAANPQGLLRPLAHVLGVGAAQISGADWRRDAPPAPLGGLLGGAGGLLGAMPRLPALGGMGAPAAPPLGAAGGMGGMPTLAPVLNVNITIPGSGAPGATADAVVAALRSRGTELMLELERVLQEVWRRQGSRTYGT